MSDSGLFTSYLNSCQPHAEWTRLLGTDADGDIPPARGGHATCLDPVNGMIYLFGGWDGEKSLDDFWVYSIKDDKWKVLSHSTSHDANAPGARSCHKMVFDTKTGYIYLLGRLNDSDGLRPSTTTLAPTPSSASASALLASITGNPARPPPVPGATSNEGLATPMPPTRSYPAEFYRYHTKGPEAGKWDFLANDTAVSILIQDPNDFISKVVNSAMVDLHWYLITKWRWIVKHKFYMFLEAESLMAIGTPSNILVCIAIMFD